MYKNNCMVICGPTASGKTRLAVEIARKAGGEIISADSRQVYRGMDIGTGKDLWEYGDVPYHLIDVADPSAVYTLYDYRRDFYKAFEDVRRRRRTPVVVGGSGLYIEAVLKGYDIPPIPEDAAFRKSMMEKEREELLGMLKDEYPHVYAKTDVSTKKRIVRALEVARFGEMATGINTDKIDIKPLVLYIVWDRPELRIRIGKRLRDRFEQGLVDEVAGLLKSGIDRERFALFGMEYKHVAKYIDGEVTYDEMFSQLLQDIFHLAKRQDTWFRGMERRGLTVHKVPRGDISALPFDINISLDIFLRFSHISTEKRKSQNMTVSTTPLKYSDAGVNIDTWNTVKGRIGELVASTYNTHVSGKFGQFGGMFDISHLKTMEAPILVSSTDSVGTKVKIAFDSGVYNTVGMDIVNHCTGDILVMGAKPLFFLDYIGINRLVPAVAEQIVEGLAAACRLNDCVLIGGETAEMPDIYSEGEFDLVGTIVGVVDGNRVVDGSTIKPDDVLIGLRSSGLHTNGYSLARKIVTEIGKKKYSDIFEGGKTFGQALLEPHRSYIKLLPLIYSGFIKGCAHITGGGFTDNVDRILPPNCDAVIDTKSWEPLPIFKYLQSTGCVENAEMYRTFNMGIGMVIAVSPQNVDSVLRDAGIIEYEPVVIGRIEQGSGIVRMKF